jgi:hypothetical protein
MNVQITQNCTIAGIAFGAGQNVEIPREYFDYQVMTRLGPQATVTAWSTYCPTWPYPINGE